MVSLNDNNTMIYIVFCVLLLISLNKHIHFATIIIMCLLFFMKPFNFNPSSFVYIIIWSIIGLFLSRIIVNAFSLTFFHKKYIRVSIKKLPSISVQCLKEEFVWRFILVYFFYNIFSEVIKVNLIALAIAELISLVSFLSVHKFLTRNQAIEALLFSILLIIVSIILPGFNVGLHTGRNMLISSEKKNK